MTIEARDPSIASVYDIPPGELTLIEINPSYVWDVSIEKELSSKLIFTCTITGADDGLTDIIVPISSFQCRMRNGDPSFLSVVVPNSGLYADAITERDNGDIVIKMGPLFSDGTFQLEEIIRVDYESLQVDRGAKSDSVTISGHKTVTASAPRNVIISGVSFYAHQMDGKRRIRSVPNMFLRPGDVCIYGNGADDWFITRVISMFVNISQTSMEVTEE
jgi:hypothetical protein